jgi:hypothetical protein
LQYHSSGSASGRHAWYLDNAEKMRLDATGLGIGTASPSQKITLGGQTGASATPLALQFSADWSDGYVAAKSKIFLFNNGGSGMWGFAVGPDNDIQYHSGGATNTNGQHKWYSGNVEFMRLNASGNLGIGTASPTVGLHVVKDQGSGYIAAFRSNVSSPYITFQTTSSITQIQGINSAFTATNDIAMQLSGGNVGIGTASPTNKLQVNGVMVGNNAAGSYTKGFGGILTTTSTSTPTGGSSGDFALIY